MTEQRLELPSDRDATGRTFGEEESQLLNQVLASGHLNCTGGTMVPRFEARFAALHGLDHGIATTSGSAAVHTALAALDLEVGDEVITSAVTDMGALAPILYQGALPVFCDLDPASLLPTAETIQARITERTRAIIVTHLFGLPCAMDAILAVAGKIPVVEDCAQAPLATWQGRPVGSFGALAAFSFQQGKHITCGEGGIVLAQDPGLARRARLFVNKAWPYGEPDPDHEFLALNYRMTELQGAVLLGQLGRLEQGLSRRRENAARMERRLAGVQGIAPPPCPAGAVHSYWRYTLGVDPDLVPGGAVALGEILRQGGVAAAPRYVGKPAFHLRVFRERVTFGTSRWPFQGARPGPEVAAPADAEFPGTFQGLERALVLPWNEHFETRHVDALADLIREGVERLRVGLG